MPGPLPTENPRRRNAPTIPTTHLPAEGLAGPVPEPPSWVELGAAGRAWWDWAWSTPQAAGWSVGDDAFVANRAGLEDDLAALSEVQSPAALDLLDTEHLQRFRELIKRLAALATGRVAILKEIREMDTRLGLTPKGLADLRWKIKAPAAPTAADTAGDEVAAKRTQRKSRLAS